MTPAVGHIRPVMSLTAIAFDQGADE
jgi:hypothetical protein